MFEADNSINIFSTKEEKHELSEAEVSNIEIDKQSSSSSTLMIVEVDDIKDDDGHFINFIGSKIKEINSNPKFSKTDKKIKKHKIKYTEKKKSKDQDKSKDKETESADLSKMFDPNKCNQFVPIRVFEKVQNENSILKSEIDNLTENISKIGVGSKLDVIGVDKDKVAEFESVISLTQTEIKMANKDLDTVEKSLNKQRVDFEK